jgi:hypothetical protein
MTRPDFKTLMVGAVTLGLSLTFAIDGSMAQTPSTQPAAPAAPKMMKIGDVLSGQLTAMQVRAPQGQACQAVPAGQRAAPVAGAGGTLQPGNRPRDV